MCHFVSAIKKGNKYLFLTDSQLWNTEKGELTRKYEGTDNPEYLRGHGTVRFFYGMDCYEGVEVEFTDFSSPKNFPEPIRKAILSGAFGRLGQPVELLNEKGKKAYVATRVEAGEVCNATIAKALKANFAIIAEALKVYDAIIAEALKVYVATTAEALKVYVATRVEADKAYNATRAEALKVCNATITDGFWSLFADPENRVEAWRIE